MLGKNPFLIGFPILLISGVAVATYGHFSQPKSATVVEKAPGIYLSSEEKDFGEVPQGSILKTEFVLTNWYDAKSNC